MTKVLLINQDKIPHYRVSVYNYLSEFLDRSGFKLTVVSGGIQDGTEQAIRFDYKEIRLSFLNLTKLILDMNPSVLIFWVNLKNLYLFPTLLFSKVLGKKIIYWGHGQDLLDKSSIIKNVAYMLEHWICDAIILYAEHIKKYVNCRFHNKIFVANNTLYFNKDRGEFMNKKKCLSKYNITTPKNIICMGRLQRRKRLEDLFRAYELINRCDIGLVLVGPDIDGVLRDARGANVYKLGSIYGNERLDLLSAADVFCLPGAVGLSIVDAFYCGLPIVTEDGEESPEIMYLKDGVNGFIVPRGDVQQLSVKLQLLLDDSVMRERFSREALKEISTNGHIDTMCKGFSDALRFCVDSNQLRKRIKGRETHDV